jgi:hypothetical protein
LKSFSEVSTGGELPSLVNGRKKVLSILKLDRSILVKMKKEGVEREQICQVAGAQFQAQLGHTDCAGHGAYQALQP